MSMLLVDSLPFMRMSKSSCSSMPKSGKHSMPKSDKRRHIKLDLAIESSGKSKCTEKMLYMVCSASFVSSAYHGKRTFQVGIIFC